MKRTFAIILAAFFMTVGGSTVVFAQQLPDYVPLSPIPSTLTTASCDPTARYDSTKPPNDPANAKVCQTNINTYVAGAFNLGIAVAGILAIIMITIAGIKYMTTEAVTSKGDAKKQINNAILGLLMALGAYLILQTVNKSLVIFNFNLPNASNTAPHVTENTLPSSISFDSTPISRDTAVTIGQDAANNAAYNPVDGQFTQANQIYAAIDSGFIDPSQQPAYLKLAQSLQDQGTANTTYAASEALIASFNPGPDSKLNSFSSSNYSITSTQGVELQQMAITVATQAKNSLVKLNASIYQDYSDPVTAANPNATGITIQSNSVAVQAQIAKLTTDANNTITAICGKLQPSDVTACMQQTILPNW